MKNFKEVFGMYNGKSYREKLTELKELIEQLQLKIEQCSKKGKKRTQKEVKEPIEEQLPKDIDKGSLHRVLGYDEDYNLQDQSEDEMIRRQKEQINSGKVTYKELIGKLNWQKVMNKTNNPQFSRKLDRIMDELKDWWEKKKEKEKK